MSPPAGRTRRRPGTTVLLRTAGVALASLLLVLGVAAALRPEAPPAVPTPTPSTSVDQPTTPSASPSPTPTDSVPPELDPPLMTGAIRVGERPVAVALDPAAGLGYTANYDGGDVSVIDLASGVVTNTLAAPGRPSAVATGPSGMVYVADRSGARVYGIDVASGRRVSVWKVGKRPVALALDVERGRLYVAVRKAVEVYDTATGERLDSVAVAAPVDLALDPQTHQLWVLSGEARTVAVYHPGAGEWTDSGLGSEGATGVEVDGARRRVYLAGPGIALQEWDLDTRTVRRLAISDAATAVRVDPASRIAYLVDPDGNAVIALSVA